MPWYNRYSGKTYRISTHPLDETDTGAIRVKSYRSILSDYRGHPEAKSLDPTGARCTSRTRGLLARRPVVARSLTQVGKESNLLEESQTGLIQSQREALNDYGGPGSDEWQSLVLSVLKTLGVREVARRTGLSGSGVSDVLRGAKPRPHNAEKYLRVAVDFAKQALVDAGVDQPSRADDFELLARYRSRADPISPEET